MENFFFAGMQSTELEGVGKTGHSYVVLPFAMVCKERIVFASVGSGRFERFLYTSRMYFGADSVTLVTVSNSGGISFSKVMPFCLRTRGADFLASFFAPFHSCLAASSGL